MTIWQRARRAVISTLLALVLLAGCGLPPSAPRTTDPPQTIPADSSPTPHGIGAATRTPLKPPAVTTPSGDPTHAPGAATTTPDVSGLEAAPRPHYLLQATLDYAGKSLAVEQTLTVPHPRDGPYPDLRLVVEPNRYPGAFHLRSVQLDGGAAEYTLEENELAIALPATPSSSGGAYRVSLAYDLFLPERSGAFGYTPLQVNLGDWYPFLPPFTEDGSWQIHPPWAYGEHLSYPTADFDVRFSLVSPDTPAGELVVAASAPAPDDAGERRYRLDGARSFALSISPHYTVVERPTPHGVVRGYAFREHAFAGEAAAQAVADALNLYSELFGPYTYPSLSVVEASFPDGMEFPGLVFVSQGFYLSYDGTPQNYLTLLSAHETAHQWWYDRVGNNQALEPWLDEALCTYSELLFYERYYPEDTAWWWGFRVHFYYPQGPVNGTLYDYPGFRPYVNATYLRGALFLHDLREAMGDEAFLRFLRAYADRYAYRQATARHFFDLLAEHTQADLAPLLAEYFRGTE